MTMFDDATPEAEAPVEEETVEEAEETTDEAEEASEDEE